MITHTLVTKYETKSAYIKGQKDEIKIQVKSFVSFYHLTVTENVLTFYIQHALQLLAHLAQQGLFE